MKLGFLFVLILIFFSASAFECDDKLDGNKTCQEKYGELKPWCNRNRVCTSENDPDYAPISLIAINVTLITVLLLSAANLLYYLLIRLRISKKHSFIISTTIIMLYIVHSWVSGLLTDPWRVMQKYNVLPILGDIFISIYFYSQYYKLDTPEDVSDMKYIPWLKRLFFQMVFVFLFGWVFNVIYLEGIGDMTPISAGISLSILFYLLSKVTNYVFDMKIQNKSKPIPIKTKLMFSEIGLILFYLFRIGFSIYLFSNFIFVCYVDYNRSNTDCGYSLYGFILGFFLLKWFHRKMKNYVGL